MIFKAGEGAGKSGSFFFFSYDNKFLIKTLGSNEKKLLMENLKDYINHIKKSKNQSLICRIYGLFTIKTNGTFVPLDIVVMQNTTQYHSPHSFRMSFDLKGSTKDRKTKFEKKFWINQPNTKKVMKDMNYIEIRKDIKNLMTLPLNEYKALCDRIKEDSET